MTKYVLRSETTEAFGGSETFNSLEDAREQMEMWVEEDKHPDCGEYDPDWAEYIVSVDEQESDRAVNGFSENENFVEGVCGKAYRGKYSGDMQTYWPEIDD